MCLLSAGCGGVFEVVCAVMVGREGSTYCGCEDWEGEGYGVRSFDIVRPVWHWEIWAFGSGELYGCVGFYVRVVQDFIEWIIGYALKGSCHQGCQNVYSNSIPIDQE